jgi:hypothetical protein
MIGKVTSPLHELPASRHGVQQPLVAVLPEEGVPLPVPQVHVERRPVDAPPVYRNRRLQLKKPKECVEGRGCQSRAPRMHLILFRLELVGPAPNPKPYLAERSFSEDMIVFRVILYLFFRLTVQTD